MNSPNRNITDIPNAAASSKYLTHNEDNHNLDVGDEPNYVINGSMAVQQRAGPFTGLGANALEYTLDMMAIATAGSPQARATVTQEDGNFDGYAKGLKIDCTTAEDAVAAGELWAFQHRVMASRLQALSHGTAGRRDLTLTFTIKSPKSGTHCVAFYKPDSTRSFIREFTVASADTAQTFTVTWPADDSGVFPDDNGEGLRITWPLVAGTTWHGANGAMIAGEDYATANQQNLLDNIANNFEITGIALRAGAVNTGHIWIERPFPDELRLCRGHYQLLGLGLTGVWDTDSICYLGTVLPVPMNGSPTITLLDTSPVVRDAGADVTGSSSAIVGGSEKKTTDAILLALNGFGTGATVGEGAVVNQTADVLELVFDL